MKNKKTFVGIALLMVVLVLGIAYAVTTIDLTITGSASANFAEANHKVAFTGVTNKSGKGTIEATATPEAINATLNVSGLTATGDTATATFEVKNFSKELASDIAVTTETLVGTNPEYFSVEASVDKTSLEKNDTATVTVTVGLVKTPVTAVTATINVGLTATAKVAGNTVNN